MDSDWSEQFKNLLSSPLGEELKRTLREDLHDTLIEKAENAKTQEDAFRLLNQAGGVIKVIEHLQFRADTGERVTPTEEGSRGEPK